MMNTLDQQLKLFYELCSVVLAILKSPQLPPHLLLVCYVTHLPLLHQEDLDLLTKFSLAGFATLLLGISIALVLYGSVTFMIGFIAWSSYSQASKTLICNFNRSTKDLFSEVGDLKRYSIHYDRSGRSKVRADVVFSRWNDVAAAAKRYNNVQLDGKPMKIEIVGTNIVTPTAMPPATNGILGSMNGAPRRIKLF